MWKIYRYSGGNTETELHKTNVVAKHIFKMNALVDLGSREILVLPKKRNGEKKAKIEQK